MQQYGSEEGEGVVRQIQVPERFRHHANHIATVQQWVELLLIEHLEHLIHLFYQPVQDQLPFRVLVRLYPRHVHKGLLEDQLALGELQPMNGQCRLVIPLRPTEVLQLLVDLFHQSFAKRVSLFQGVQVDLLADHFSGCGS